MAKTSIFSKEYEKRRRRKRRRIVLAVVLIMLIVGCGVLYSQGNIYLDKIKNIFVNKNEPKNKIKEQSPNNTVDNSKKNSQENKNEQKSEEKKFIEIKLASGSSAKALYDEDSTGKKFVLVEPLQDGSTFDISKSAKNILINDATTQEIKIYDTNGTEKNVTKPNYTTQSGQVFTKDNILKQYQGYAWSKNAKFIDDDHIVYLSQLPWFKTGDADTFMWLIDVNTGEHKTLWNVKGKQIQIGTLNDKGITVVIDGNNKTVTADGNLI